jgi:hypothetical protein
MRTRSTAVLVGLPAALVMALAVGSASANRLSYSNQSFRITWSSLTFSGSGGGFPITCPVTLEGSFHSSTMAKTTELQVAHITRAAVGTCQEGTGAILRESLPWRVTFRSFSGTLPNITSVRHYLIGAAFQVEPGFGIVCLATTSTEFPAAGDANREAGGNITSLTPDSSLAIPVTGSPQCPLAGIFSGTGEVFVLGSSSTRVRLTLI